MNEFSCSINFLNRGNQLVVLTSSINGMLTLTPIVGPALTPSSVIYGIVLGEESFVSKMYVEGKMYQTLTTEICKEMRLECDSGAHGPGCVCLSLSYSLPSARAIKMIRMRMLLAASSSVGVEECLNFFSVSPAMSVPATSHPPLQPPFNMPAKSTQSNYTPYPRNASICYHITPPSPFLSNTLLNPIQPRAIHSNLIIHLVRLARNPLNMLILRVHFLAHRATEMIEAFGCAVEGICIVCQYTTHPCPLPVPTSQNIPRYKK